MKIKNFSLKFGRKLFFQNLAFELEKGRLHTLAGKNGSGKSTLLAALRGDLLAVTGSVEIGGMVYPISGVLRNKIALISQRFDEMIADQFSFLENLEFAKLNSRPSLWKGFQKEVFLPPFIERFGIDYHKPVRLLSGGQRQVLALLMALQKQPSILFLDEPTATLDAVNAQMVFQFVRQLIEECQLTALVICHDEELAASYRSGSCFQIGIEQSGLRYLTSS
ncbi:MAG TPA: ATP-binding cassette domain-containing protein [Rhabdochlamydiaceae bacterium]|jgi:ABC-type multidrug transport system ATPase subunit|nr:ATP-binding cassette domain-containing protein [Rhabdochlamydiaceae bacterium]